MKPFALFICTLLLFAFTQGCKKDSSKSNNNAIVGAWALNSGTLSTGSPVYAYTFKADGTFEFSSSTIGAPIKYYYTQKGNYTLNADQLVFTNVTSYGIPDNGSIPVPKEQLVSRGASLSNTYTAGFNSKKDSLSLVIHCPPNANCIGLQWYKRQ